MKLKKLLKKVDEIVDKIVENPDKSYILRKIEEDEKGKQTFEILFYGIEYGKGGRIMTDYEQMIISAERYALARMTYIVEITVNYILKEIEEDKLSNRCLSVIAEDIKSKKNYGMEYDRKLWIKLLDRIEEVI